MIIFSRDMEAVMLLSKMMCLGLVMAMFMAFSLACCSDKTPEPGTEGTGTGDPEALGPAESLETEVSENDNIMEGRTSGPMLPVYFDFDSATIQSDQVQRIEGNAEYIKANGTIGKTFVVWS